jgi:sporulation protein YlmC with PRC-barrel domain
MLVVGNRVWMRKSGGRRLSGMEGRGLVGLAARTVDGTEVGRISEVVADEESGEVTHVVVEREDELMEVPISEISLDPEEDFVTVRSDASDDEPGDHLGDEAVGPEEPAPLASDVEDTRHEGQFVSEPESPEESQTEEDLAREDWEDESYTPVDSGYPRTDAYIDPETGEEEVDPALREGNDPADEVARVLDGTELEARSVRDGVVELSGSASREELEAAMSNLMEIPEVSEVDAADVVDVG